MSNNQAADHDAARRRRWLSLGLSVVALALCAMAMTSSAASAAVPEIITQASPTMQLGQGQLTDTATVTGLVNPVTGPGAGTVTFVLYGPDDPVCSDPIFTSANRPLTLTGTTGTATSAAFTPTAAGVYQWIASYSGDANNLPVSGVCGDANEQTVVQPPPPPAMPTTKEQCMNGGWRTYGVFNNQGDCVSFVEAGAKK